jgi:outer membrane receptor protein involved in Fe transport
MEFSDRWDIFARNPLSGINTLRRGALASLTASVAVLGPVQLQALEIEEVIVTAQKKAQSINDVGMAITAFSGDAMKELGVSDTTDMAALTPGLTYTSVFFGPPIYTMRGVGFKDTSYNASATVGVYVDEAAIAYPIMTLGAVLDLERVEVLKGPQGTLYGRNNTGGAINYIANKPSEEFEAGITASYGRYNTFETEGYINGALSENVRGRLAVSTTQSNEGWQRNVVTGDRLGEQDNSALRLSLAADLNQDLDALLQVGWWQNKSDAPGGQVVRAAYQSPGNAGVIAVMEPWIEAFTADGEDNKVAGWTPGQDLSNNMDSTSVTLRLNYAINETLNLTSISSFAQFEDDGGRRDIGGFGVPNADAAVFLMGPDLTGNLNDGNPIPLAPETEWPWVANFLLENDAEIDTFSQEIRLSAEYENMSWIAGLYYAQDEVRSIVTQHIPLTTNSNGLGGGVINFGSAVQDGISETETIGLFVHTEWQLGDDFRLTAGLRYSDDKNDYSNCLRDGGDGLFGQLFGLGPGQCVTRLSSGDRGLFEDSLSEDSISGRLNLDWFVNDDIMAYASFSRGFKAGSFPNNAATVAGQLAPVVQEELNAYELGFKATLDEGAMQLNGSVYYSDYTDKQLLGVAEDPVFGVLRRLVNVPESEIYGAELDVQWQPMDGLFLSAGAAWVDTEVKGDFLAPNAFAQVINYGGSKFTDTADLQLTALINYEWPINDSINAFIGADASYTDDMHADYEPGRMIEGVDASAPTQLDSAFLIDGYTLVNARLGIASSEETWRLMLWGRNLTDEFYVNNVRNNLDTIVNYVGMPRTYGITVEFHHF